MPNLYSDYGPSAGGGYIPRPYRPYAASGGGYIPRPYRPYAASGAASRLTEKERAARAQTRTASYSTGPAFGNSVYSSSPQFYSAPLSTDFLELPQSPREKRELYRHFYKYDEIVGAAIDTHVELLMSRLRLAPPRPRTCPPGFDSPEDFGLYIKSRFDKMVKKTKLFQKLIELMHHYWLDGGAVVFAEDTAVDVPAEIPEEKTDLYYRAHYAGWGKLLVLPIDRCIISSTSLSDKVRIEMIPSQKDHDILMKADAGDESARALSADIPVEVQEYIRSSKPIPLGTDPDEGSFAYLFTARRFADEDVGFSQLDRCSRTLIKRDKLRQAQTSIASRAMTPRRLVWAEGLSEADTEELREQVDLALQDPDFSVVLNYEAHWDEQSSRDRLLDLQGENESDERRLTIGLGMTESLLSGEALFSGDRFKLHVINQKYMHVRDRLQEYVEDNLFRPVAERMGFIETDKWGQPQVLFPKLCFNRLPLQDSQDFFDAIWNLYSKGSVSVDVVLEALNIDPYLAEQKVRADLMTPNDPIFNEILRSSYGEIGRILPEQTDMLERVAGQLRLKVKPKEEDDGGGGGGMGRFASSRASGRRLMSV